MTWLVGLLGFVIAALYIYGYFKAIKAQPDNPGVRLPLKIRIALSFLLLMAAAFISSVVPGPYPLWILFGMAFSTLGDLFMAKIIPLPNRLYGGIGAFTMAHIFYVTAFVIALSSRGYMQGKPLLVGLVAYGFFNAAAYIFLVRNPGGKLYKEIGLLFLFYILWIGVMAAFAFSLAVNLGGGAWLAAFGALSFVVSDLIIGLTVIGERRFNRSELWVWLSYVLGQMSIIYAGIFLPA